MSGGDAERLDANITTMIPVSQPTKSEISVQGARPANFAAT